MVPSDSLTAGGYKVLGGHSACSQFSVLHQLGCSNTFQTQTGLAFHDTSVLPSRARPEGGTRSQPGEAPNLPHCCDKLISNHLA